MLYSLPLIGIFPIFILLFYKMELRKLAKGYGEAPFTHHLMLSLLKDYNRPNDKISELLKQGELISLRRGLYIAGPEVGLPRPHPFLMANHLCGPSYVSLESALSFWGLIPERVVETTSVTTSTSKKYSSAAGRYSFQHLPTPYFAFGIERIQLTEKQTALIASAEKAVCDMIVLTAGISLRSPKQTKKYLVEDLRMDEEVLNKLDSSRIRQWLKHAPKQASIEMLIKTLQQL